MLGAFACLHFGVGCLIFSVLVEVLKTWRVRAHVPTAQLHLFKHAGRGEARDLLDLAPDAQVEVAQKVTGEPVFVVRSSLLLEFLGGADDIL